MSATITPPPESERLRIAGMAHATALGIRGVRRTDPGSAGEFATVENSGRVAGVMCAAAAGGGYDASLRLVCELVPLHELCEQVRTAVKERASSAGLNLRRVDVHVTDVVPAVPL